MRVSTAHARLHAQITECSQPAQQTGWDLAAKRVVAEVTAQKTETQISAKRRGACKHSTCTHRVCNAVRALRLEGMVPLSWLLLTELRSRHSHVMSALSTGLGSSERVRTVGPEQ